MQRRWSHERPSEVSRFALWVMVAVVASAWASGVRAEGGPPEQGEGDPPGVARVSLIEGEASYFRRDGDDWTGVAVNAPLVTGDRFYSGDESRAEIQLAPATYARLGAETEVDFVELAPDVTHVRVTVGRVTMRLRDEPRGHVELDTPTVALVLEGPGAYRVDVDVGGRTTVRVEGGDAVAHVGSKEYDLSGDTGAIIDDVGGGLGFRTVAYAPEDDFDLWEESRNARVETAASYQHVDEAIYGAEDLDQYGTWEYESDYGYLWRPTVVSAGWAPYTYGRWSYVGPWGWTWIDDAPWGWAPFHYGRWLYRSSYWYWAPGPLGPPPIYAPALVGFYGEWGGFGASVSFGFGGYGSIGWVPLGWGEPCFPWWGGWGGARVGYPWWGGWGGPWVVNNNVIINKNITNINVNDVRYTNRFNPGGFSTVPREDFGHGGRPIAARGADLDGFQPIGGRVDVTPDRDAFQIADPSRVNVGRGARPSGAVGRDSITRTAGGRDGRSAEGGRRAVASSRDAPATSGRESIGRRSFASGSDRSRSGVPRPPAEVSSKTVTAPRTASGRRSTPYVAVRPATSGSREGWTGARSGWSSAGRAKSAARATTDSRGTRGTTGGRASGSGFSRPPTWSRSESTGSAGRSGIVRSTSSPRGSFSQVGRAGGGGSGNSRAASSGGRSAWGGTPSTSAPHSAQRQSAVVSRPDPSSYASAAPTSRGYASPPPTTSRVPFGGSRPSYSAPTQSQLRASNGASRPSSSPPSYSYSAPSQSRSAFGSSSSGMRSSPGGSGFGSGGGFSGSRGFGSFGRGGGGGGGRAGFGR